MPPTHYHIMYTRRFKLNWDHQSETRDKFVQIVQITAENKCIRDAKNTREESFLNAICTEIK